MICSLSLSALMISRCMAWQCSLLTYSVKQPVHCCRDLEFDDVFLLDFFADSPANAEWRVLLTYLEEYCF